MTFKAKASQWFTRLREAHHDKFRAFSFLLVFILMMAIVQQLNPAKGGMMLWMVAKGAFAVWAGYWSDRILYRSSRPHTLEGIARGAAEKRRASIVFGWLVVAAFLP